MKTVVEIPELPNPKLNPNQRLHHYSLAKAKTDAKEEMEFTLKTIDLPDQPYENAILKIEFIANDRRRRDLDNLLASCKSYIDAFVDGGSIVDDSGKRLSYIEGHYRVDKKEGNKTIFTITKRSPEDESSI